MDPRDQVRRVPPGGPRGAGRGDSLVPHGRDWTGRFPEIVAESAGLPDGILDGELFARNLKGQPDFPALRAAISPGKTARLALFVFGILWRGQDDLPTIALKDRKEILARPIGTEPRD